MTAVRRIEWLANRRFRLALTPAGAGVFTLFFPGLLVVALARHRLLLAVGVGAGLVLAVNIVLAALALRPVSVSVQAPAVATVDEGFDVTVAVGGQRPHLACAVNVEGCPRWVPVRAPAAGSVTVLVSRRSLIEELAVSLRTSVPFGLVEVAHTRTVALDAALAVALASISTPVAPVTATGASSRWTTSDDPAGLRRYQPGDLKRDVHWPSVARTGTLLVRDRRPSTGTAPPRLSVVPTSPDGLDRALARARSAGEQLLAAGQRIRVDRSVISGPGRPPTQADSTVTSRYELARHLATIDTTSDTAAERRRPIEIAPTLLVDEDGARWLHAD